jgi:uncharacterized membrane protein
VNWLIVVLRLLHIFAGVFWAGAIFTLARFVLPTVAASGAEGQRFMRSLALERGLTKTVTIAGLLSVLAGLWLMGIDSAWFQPSWMGSGMGVVLSIGALSGLGAAAVGVRSGLKASRLGVLFNEMDAAKGSPRPELVAEVQQISAKLAAGVRAVAIMLAITVICMAVARYVVF